MGAIHIEGFSSLFSVQDIKNAVGNEKTRKPKRKVAVIDFETDPFKFGRIPEPFCCEFYTDTINQVFWGEDCAEQLCRFLEAQEERYLIYAHNGGKFDAHFILKYIDNPALVIKTRIVEAKLFHHTFRDSFAILPVPLRDYEKMEFDYAKMEREVRNKYKSSILEYLHSDCVNLYNLVNAFVERFGPRLTIGGTAMKEIQKLHPFVKSGSAHDAAFRPFYFGGRVQCFSSGILTGPKKLFDVNSMYPASMKYKKHPINGKFDWLDERPTSFDMPYFLTFKGRQVNALPALDENGNLTFNKNEGIFKVCSHELEIALEHNLVVIDEVLECLLATEATTFDGFVDKFYEEKSASKLAGDKTNELFAKLLLNSGYGRFGINPENFADWHIHKDFGEEERLIEQGYTIACDLEEIELWERAAEIKEESYCDVSVAASITSGARAILLEGLQNSINPHYCDTDSIICDDFTGDVDKYRLGAWDLEKITDHCDIAGRKMYSMYNNGDLDAFVSNKIKKIHTTITCSKCKLPLSSPVKKKEHETTCSVKLSSKGGSLNLFEIHRICLGETVSYENDAPTFSLKRDPTFVKRNFKSTIDKLETVD